MNRRGVSTGAELRLDPASPQGLCAVGVTQHSPAHPLPSHRCFPMSGMWVDPLEYTRHRRECKNSTMKVISNLTLSTYAGAQARALHFTGE